MNLDTIELWLGNDMTKELEISMKKIFSEAYEALLSQKARDPHEISILRGRMQVSDEVLGVIRRARGLFRSELRECP